MSNGVNALIARGGNFPQAPMPDIMRSYRQAQAAKGMQNQLALQKAQLEDLPGERAWRRETRGQQRKQWKETEEDKKFEREIKAISMATKAADPKQAEAIYKSLNPGGADYDFEFVRGNIKVSIEGFEVEGPAKQVGEFYELLQENLSKPNDPETKKAIIRNIFASAAKLGINVTVPEEKEKKETAEQKLERAKKLETWKAKFRGYKPQTKEEALELKRAGKAEPDNQKKLTDIASDYQQTIGRYYSLMSGVGIMSEALGKKNEQMAQAAKTQADNLAKRYKELGGDPADLGVMESEDTGLRDEAIELLKANNKKINEETIKQVIDKLKAK